MEVDIVPELYGKIRKDFDEAAETDEMLSRIYAKIEKGTATHIETQHYAQRIGECAAEAIKKNLTEGILPDGKLYYNIAERTIQPTLEHNHELVNQVASQIQESLNAAAGLGIKPITAEMDAERVERVVNAAVYAEDFGSMQSELAEGIINTTQSFADDFVRENAEFQARAGLSPKITRISTGKCCDWCEKLAGTYEYDDLLDKSVFHRHKYCRCIVTYDQGDGRKQNVHTKQWQSAEEYAAFEEKKKLGIKSTPLQLAEHPARLAAYTPERLFEVLKEEGFEIKTLKRGSLKDVKFEDGGGFKVNFEDGGLLQYHPKNKSHHGGAYYKISTGRGGTKRYDLEGNEK